MDCSKVQSKKAEATSVGFTYDGGKSIDSMATLGSFFKWFNLYAYDKINVFGSSESYLGFTLSNNEYCIVIRNICITVRYQYSFQGKVTVSKTVKLSKLGFGTTEIAETSYTTQGDLYSDLLVYIDRAWSLSS